jgi:hypothetical protein
MFPRTHLALASLTLLTLANPSRAQNHDGVAAGPSMRVLSVRQQPALPPQALAAVNLIDFDDNSEPCTFLQTKALRTKYAALGVYFDGPAGLDGGAILDECSNFGVSGHSSPNFLAFNTFAVLSDGGVPQGPETIKFAFPVNTVKILAGAGSGTIKMEAFDGGGNSLGGNSISAGGALQGLGVAAPGIRSVVISFSDVVCVLDDLTWQAEPPVTYCTAKTGLVCGTPSIGWSGAPSASMVSGFEIISKPARDNRVGILLYSHAGRNNTPFQGGVLCVALPLRRSVPVKSGGTPNQCDGAFVLDMNAFSSGGLGGNPAAFLLVVGTIVDTQWWGRDSQMTGSFLSDGLEYYVLP